MVEARRVHFIGIGGVGMSALAKVLLEEGYTVSGSDLHPSPLALRLAEQGAAVFEGHRPENIDDAELVVITAAVHADNPELRAAEVRGLPVIKRAELLARLMREKQGVAVAGCHGKTTTSSLIGHVFEQGGLDPTVLVGGEIINFGSNARVGHGPHLVAEADEYDGSFLRLTPAIAVVTNIDADHLDYYGSMESLTGAFVRFMAQVPEAGSLVLCADDPTLRSIIAQRGDRETRLQTQHIITYALDHDADWQGKDIRRTEDGGSDFAARFHGDAWGLCRLQIPGRHNVSNALAAIAAAQLAGIPKDRIVAALASFQGARRRFEVRGDAGGITVVDDYGHHPTEIRATLRAARERYGGRRLICLFQPHTYTRTRNLFDEFTTCFEEADAAFITDIYAARETDTLGMSSALLASALKKPQGRYVGDLRQAEHVLLAELRAGDVLMVVGAGDVDEVCEALLQGLERR